MGALVAHQTSRRVSSRQVRAAAGEAVLPALKAYEARVISLEAIVNGGFLARLRWLVLGR